MKFNTHFTKRTYKGQSFAKGSSLTQPDQSVTIRELMNRHVNPADVKPSGPQIYDDQPELFPSLFPGWKKGDKIDKIELLRRAEAEVAHAKNVISDAGRAAIADAIKLARAKAINDNAIREKRRKRIAADHGAGK